MDRVSIFEWVKKQYGTEPEYLWAKSPNSAVLRNDTNNKWYGIIMDVSKNKLGLSGDEIVDVLNVKCDPILIGSLRQHPGFLPAYHMNKTYWVSILLDGTVSFEEITNLLGLSYQMTMPKKKKKINTGSSL